MNAVLLVLRISPNEEISPYFAALTEFKTIFVFDPVCTLDVNTNWRKPQEQRVTLAENELETNQNTRVERGK